MKSWPYWLAATLILAGIIHIVAILLWPSFVMDRLISGLEARSALNVAIHTPRADENARTVVRPSPDLIYTICAFDVSQRPLAISAPVPPETYFSLSMFADNTDNFFVVNDKQLTKDIVEVVLVKDEAQVTELGGPPVVVAPSERGVLLFRTLIQSEDRFDTLDAIRKQARCETLSPAPQS
ncbi:MAG: DUF1254 domain-containing protein [Alphaproteobacteria bacterium]|mgnify:CR=1 FL=1|nr:DUF1254 domain-containing protein [Alphaproteobacteria bacterium]MBO6628898.1 DUF1254 domain-containing protein [Alphaproteobacteria bacterium]MDF1625901.1 DUF1254 domain-containing protein [Parvibaculaceae bacterium]